MQPEFPQEEETLWVHLQPGVDEKRAPAIGAVASILDIFVARHDRPRPRLPNGDRPQRLFHHTSLRESTLSFMELMSHHLSVNKGGFSWKRFVGLSAAKSRISRATGIPFTRSGRHQKTTNSRSPHI